MNKINVLLSQQEKYIHNKTWIYKKLQKYNSCTYKSKAVKIIFKFKYYKSMEFHYHIVLQDLPLIIKKIHVHHKIYYLLRNVFFNKYVERWKL